MKESLKILSIIFILSLLSSSLHAEQITTNDVDYAKIISIAKDIILIIVAITTISLALIGLGAWKKQLKGKVEYELAHRVLRTTYRLRDAIKQARHPAVWAYEMEEPSEIKDFTITNKQNHYNGLVRAYQARWTKVEDTRADLYVELLESEVIWGEELKECFAIAFKLENELF